MTAIPEGRNKQRASDKKIDFCAKTRMNNHSWDVSNNHALEIIYERLVRFPWFSCKSDTDPSGFIGPHSQGFDIPAR
jgi:hypothetical protein